MPRKRTDDDVYEGEATKPKTVLRVQQSDGTVREVDLEEKPAYCPLCDRIGTLPFPEFEMGYWYQFDFPCTCLAGAVAKARRGFRYFAGEKPGQPRGLNARQLSALWMATSGKTSLIEAAQALHKATGAPWSKQILDACVDAAALEEMVSERSVGF